LARHEKKVEALMIGKAMAGIAAAALLSGSALMAEPSGAGQTKTKDNPNRRVCRTYHDTGTRLGSYRACHTLAEWTEMRRQTIQIVDHIQNARVFGTSN
jgi:hypothetical protein